MRQSIARTPITALLVAPLWVALAPTLAAAQVEDVGSSNTTESGSAEFVSRDGDTLIGRSFNRVYRWTRSGGYVDLQLPPQREAVPSGISDDGAFASGHIIEGSDFRSVRWSADGTFEYLGSFFSTPGAIGDRTLSRAISGDGTTVVGYGSFDGGATSVWRAYRWTEANGLENIHPASVPATFFSTSTHVSSDGSIVIGSVFDPANVVPEGMFVRAAGSATVMVDDLALVSARPVALSADGNQIFGQGDFGGPSDELFRWTPAVGVQRLAVLPSNSLVVGVSADGSRVLINPQRFWTSATGIVEIPGPPFTPWSVSDDGSVILGTVSTFDPAIWTQQSGVVELPDLGAQPLTFKISGDGSAVVGNIDRPDGVRRPARWNLVDDSIGAPYCGPASPHSASADGGRMQALGTNIGGFDDTRLRASNLPPNVFGIFIAGREEVSVTVQSGTLCVGPAIMRFVGPGQIKNAGPAGTFELALDREDLRPLLGGILPPFGETVRFQAWFRDGGSSNLTDAVALPLF